VRVAEGSTAKVWVGRGARLAAAGLAVAAIGALAIGKDATGSQALSVVSPTPGGTATSVAPSIAGSPAADVARLEQALAPVFGGTAPTITDAGAIAPPLSSDDGTTSVTVAPDGSAGSGKVAVVSGTLYSFAFGSKVALPLVCNAAVGGLTTAVTDPDVARVLTQISQSCTEYGNQGSAALLGLEQDLNALAAANPALDPLIEQFTGLLTAAADSGVPFADSVRQLVALVDFFHS
jgi:hypothetical protein